MTDLPMPTVLVTGASSGIGLACVRLLRERGYSIVGVSRRPTDPDAECSSQSTCRVLHLQADLTTEEGTSSVVRFMFDSRETLALVGLINCAGVGNSGALAVMDTAEIRRLFEINFFSAVSLIIQLLPLLRENAGRIINIGSTSGRIPRPLVGAYSASKAALESFTRTLRMEEGSGGVKVVMIEPGVVDTPFWKTMRHIGHDSQTNHDGLEASREGGKPQSLTKTLRGMSPDVVAGVVLQALKESSPKSRYIVGADARKALLLDSVMPDWASDWMRSWVRRQ